MSLWFEGGNVALSYWKPLLVFLSAALGYGYWASSFVSGKPRSTRWLSFPLGLGAGMLLVTLLSFAVFMIGLVWQSFIPLGAYLILLGGLALLVLHLIHRENWPLFIFSLLIFFLLLLVRLTFISGLVLPPYSDSPAHYMVVLNLLEPGTRPDAYYSLGSIFQHYYHYGVHSLTAWVALVSGERSPLLLALMGQLSLAVLPFSVFALVGALTGKKSAAWIAGALAGFGWIVPAFGVNWGKYPAIAGLSVFPVLLAYLWLVGRSKSQISKGVSLLAGLLFGGTALLHSRTTLLLALAVGAYLAARILTRFSKNRFALPAITLLLSAGAVYWGWTRPDLSGFYTVNWPVLIAILIMLPFAYFSFSAFTVAGLMSLLGVALLASWHAPAFMAKYTFQLLDRQFVQLSLFLPLAILGGLGVAGLEKYFSKKRWVGTLVLLLFVVLIYAQSPATQSYYPDRCCSYVTENDILAFDWLKTHAISDSLVVIATLPSSQRMIEMDAGMWVYALTGLDIQMRSSNSSLEDPDFVLTICQNRTDVYLYIGGNRMSFRTTRLSSDFDFYEVVFSSGITQILQVKACP